MVEVKKIENFKKWLCSFSGCNGGNPRANIWISGIEWGWRDKNKDCEPPRGKPRGITASRVTFGHNSSCACPVSSLP